MICRKAILEVRKRDMTDRTQELDIQLYNSHGRKKCALTGAMLVDWAIAPDTEVLCAFTLIWDVADQLCDF